MRADRSCNEGKRVFVQYHFQCFAVLFLPDKGDVFRHVLMDRTSFCTWRNKTVSQRQFIFFSKNVSVLDRFPVPFIRFSFFYEAIQHYLVNTIKSPISRPGKCFRYLPESVVAAGLQKCCCHCDRPDACVEKILNICLVCSAGPGDTQFASKLF